MFKYLLIVNVLFLNITSSLYAKEEVYSSNKCNNVKVVIGSHKKDQQYILINGKSIKIDQSLDYDFRACMTLKNKKYIQIEYNDGTSWIGSLYIDTNTLKVEDQPYSQEHINHLLFGNQS